MSEFAVDVSTRAAQCIITVAGDVDVDVATRLGLAGVAAVGSADPTCAVVVIDLSAVTIIDSSGLAALVSISNAAAGADKSVQLRGVRDQTAKILKITGLDATFDVHPAAGDRC